MLNNMLILETNKFKIISDQGREFIPTCKVCGRLVSDSSIDFHIEPQNFIGEWKAYIKDSGIRTFEAQCCLNRIKLHGQWVNKEFNIHYMESSRDLYATTENK